MINEPIKRRFGARAHSARLAELRAARGSPTVRGGELGKGEVGLGEIAPGWATLGHSLVFRLKPARSLRRFSLVRRPASQEDERSEPEIRRDVGSGYDKLLRARFTRSFSLLFFLFLFVFIPERHRHLRAGETRGAGPEPGGKDPPRPPLPPNLRQRDEAYGRTRDK